MITISSAQLSLWVAAFTWPFIRILAVLATAPIFDNRLVPRRVRVGLAGLLAILISPWLPESPPINATDSFLILFQQIAIGVALGFSMRLIFAAFEMAGELIGLQMGLAFAQFIDPMRGGQTPLVGSFLTVLASMVFLVLDGHLLVIASLIQTFELIPVGSQVSGIQASNIVQSGSIIFLLALQMTLPVLAAILVCNIVMGILTRAAPQLNIMSIGFAVTILGGLWLMWASMPTFVAGVDEVITRIKGVIVFSPQ